MWPALCHIKPRSQTIARVKENRRTDTVPEFSEIQVQIYRIRMFLVMHNPMVAPPPTYHQGAVIK